ncbi:MAG: hypothetical protein AAF615_02800 [Pseudomonadota bacterium]
MKRTPRSNVLRPGSPMNFDCKRRAPQVVTAAIFVMLSSLGSMGF